MRRVLSTKLPLNKEITNKEFYELIIRWLKNYHTSQDAGIEFEKQQDKTKIKIQKEFVLIENIEFDNQNIRYVLFKMQHKFREQLWETELILETTENKVEVFVHINCSSDRIFETVPAERKEILKMIVQSGIVVSDVLEIQNKPIELTYDKIDFIADIMSNGCKLPLPIVYVSKIFGCDGYEVDVESLADNLAGIAYVIIEKTSDIADMLKTKIGKNPYNGTIGIYYPNGSNEKIKPNEKNKIIPNIEKSVTAMVDKLALTWEQFRFDKITSDAKQAEELLENVSDKNDSLENKLKLATEKISLLKNENINLKQQVNGLQCAIKSNSTESKIVANACVEEFFEGEQYDLIITLLQEAYKNCNKNTRKYELISALLETNSSIGNGKKILEGVKNILSKKDKLGEREISELKRIGFELKSESNHYKFIYRDNEKYTFIVSKTPSDFRGNKNKVQKIINELSVY